MEEESHFCTAALSFQTLFSAAREREREREELTRVQGAWPI